MSKYIAISAGLVLLIGSTQGIAAGVASSAIKCKDGTEVYLESACVHHGGAQMMIAATVDNSRKVIKPIQANSTPTKRMANTTTKPKVNSVANATAPRMKVAARTKRDPTARCLDGALYYSTERRNACGAHGGVAKWYGW